MAHFVIIGGGLAAGSAAKTLRESGFDGGVTVVAAEPHAPYQRPPLSKGYLLGEEGTDAVILEPAEWYADHDIDLRTGTSVTGLDPAARTVSLDDGSTLSYDAVLLTMGAGPRMLPIEGNDLDGVVTLRTLDDSDGLAAQLKDGGKRLVIIGAGWIGMEAAATARQLGNEVTVLERDPVPLAAALGPELGEVFKKLHLEHGVDLRTSVGVDRIVGNGHVTGVVVEGETVPADLVLIGVGAAPNTALAEAAGLDMGNGILTDSGFHTSAPDVFAAGDVANVYHPVVQRHLRSEHWDNAQRTGAAAARSMLGERVSYREIPYFYTDQYDLGMELSGYPPLMSEAEVVIRGDKDGREFIAFWVDRDEDAGTGRVVGGMNVNVWDVNEHVQALIRSGEAVDLAALRDPAVPLDSLVTS